MRLEMGQTGASREEGDYSPPPLDAQIADHNPLTGTLKLKKFLGLATQGAGM